MNTKGFTLIELIIVIAIMGVLVGIVGLFFGVSRNEVDLRNTTIAIEDILRRAREQTMSGRLDSVWGVHFEVGSATLFKGNTYVIGAPENVTVNTPATITISSVLLTGGGIDIIFQDKLGSTATDGNITVIDSISGISKVISVIPIGTIQIQ